VSKSEHTTILRERRIQISSEEIGGRAAMDGQLKSRVLLVEDEPVLQRLIAGYLVAAGYAVRTADDGLDAITKLRAGLPDLIISDLNMPRMSGLEFLGLVHKRLPQTPVIVTSAGAPDEMPSGVTADAFYHKNGFGFQQLLETISDLTGKPPARSAPPPVENEPVQARWHESGSYIIGCGDCLREFKIPRIFHVEGTQNWTSCVHCGKFVHFLGAEHSVEARAAG
jgi:CheY-like chemotaxis protein